MDKESDKGAKINRRTRRKPAERDLIIWRSVQHELLDYLYKGLAGRFQVAGHRLIDRWARRYANGVVLEIGCGHGHHLRYSENSYPLYIGLDIENKFLRTLRERFLGMIVVNGDAYALPFQDNSVDCVLSVYCFEHLRCLPECLAEIRRVLKLEGELLVSLPAEGGLLYGIGRWLTSKRYMERKYRIDYDTIVQWEHWNTCNETVNMIKTQFYINEIISLPFKWLSTSHLNIITCLRCCKR